MVDPSESIVRYRNRRICGAHRGVNRSLLYDQIRYRAVAMVRAGSDRVTARSEPGRRTTWRGSRLARLCSTPITAPFRSGDFFAGTRLLLGKLAPSSDPGP